MSQFKMRVEEPPVNRTGRKNSITQAALEFARANSSQWCAIAEYDGRNAAGSVASALNRRHGKGGYEFVSRTVTDAKRTVYRVYCRYTPPAEAEAA